MLNKLDFLAKVPLFSLMKEMDLHRISLLARDDHFQRGEIIIREGDHDRRLFIIISGEVDVIKDLGGKNEKKMGIMGPYSYFGEMALIDDMVRSASVVARGETHLLSLDHLNLRKEIDKYPALAVELLQMLSRRIRAIEKNLMNTLGTLLPLCSQCKKIREDNGTWVVIEEYIEDHSDAEFSHSICPECSEKLYPEFYKKN
jgi:CRP-like cAMP-binding protein